MPFEHFVTDSHDQALKALKKATEGNPKLQQAIIADFEKKWEKQFGVHVHGPVVGHFQSKESNMSPAGVSLKPSDATQGGAIIESGDVTIESVRTALWDYQGKIPVPQPALAVTIDAGEQGKFTQMYSAGKAEQFVPSDDMRRFIPVGGAPGINQNTNAMMFLVSLVNAGFPEDKIGDDVAVFDGTRCHMHTVPQPKRPGLTNAEGKTVLVVDKIHSLPWEAAAPTAPKAKAAAPKAAAKPAAVAAPVQQQAAAASVSAPAADPTSPLWAQATEGVLSLVTSKGGSLLKKDIAGLAFSLFAKDPNRNALVQLMYKDEFLGAEGQPWNFDGTTVSMG